MMTDLSINSAFRTVQFMFRIYLGNTLKCNEDEWGVSDDSDVQLAS